MDKNIVFKAWTNTVYHDLGCDRIGDAKKWFEKNPEKHQEFLIPLNEAIEKGYRPCSVCRRDDYKRIRHECLLDVFCNTCIQKDCKYCKVTDLKEWLKAGYPVDLP